MHTNVGAVDCTATGTLLPGLSLAPEANDHRVSLRRFSVSFCFGILFTALGVAYGQGTGIRRRRGFAGLVEESGARLVVEVAGGFHAQLGTKAPLHTIRGVGR